jgi:predicted transcriptional regulator
MVIDNESFKLLNWDFMVFLAIVTTPMLVFRGSFEDFLRYVEVTVTDKNIKLLKESLSNLEERNYISYDLDRTDSNYFVAAICRKTEEEMQIGIGMIRDCKRLAEKYHKRSWVPILKTWLGVEMLSKTQPYTMEDLQKVTGLSAYQIKESNKVLKESCIFRTSKAYANYQQCIGTRVDLNINAFYKI